MYQAFVRDHKGEFETVLDTNMTYVCVKIVKITVYYITTIKVHDPFSNCTKLKRI